jgi:1-acyl-sn-glycerol-3-phosphate acyltransferase
MIRNKYLKLLLKILIYTIGFIKLRKLYLNPLYFLIDKFYSKKIKIIGKKNIPKDDGYVIISNHYFLSEIFLIKNIFKKINIVSSKSKITEFLDINNLLIHYDRTPDNIKKSGTIIKNIILNDCVKRKKNILVFPEGTSTNVNEMFMFKKGLFHLCYDNNIPIVPIIICVKKEIHRMHYFCFDEKIKVKIFEKVNSNEFNNFDEYYNYIYNLMNDYLKNYLNDKNTKISIMI